MMIENRLFQNLYLSFLIIEIFQVSAQEEDGKRKLDWKSLKRQNAPERLTDTKLETQYAGVLRKLNDIIIKLSDKKPCEYVCSFNMQLNK